MPELLKSLCSLNFFFGIISNNDGPNIKNDKSNSDEYSGNNTTRSSCSSSTQTDLIVICTMEIFKVQENSE